MSTSDGVDKYFSVVALFILFRETVEASLIVGVLLQMLTRLGFQRLRKQVWLGTAAGLVVSVIFGVIFICIYYVARDNVFTGNNKAIFKGSVAWFAGTLITILAFAMMRYKGWEDKIRRKLETKAEQELYKNETGDQEAVPAEPTWRDRAKERTAVCMRTTCTPVGRACTSCWASVSVCWHASLRAVTCGKLGLAEPTQPALTDADAITTSKDSWGIFLLVATTVMREGIESVIFLAGVGNAAPSSLPLPGFVGFVCGIALGMFMYYSGKTVKQLKWFLIIMSVVLFFIAGGQFLLGTDFLITGGMFGYCSPWVNDRPSYMQPLWDLSSCCGDTDNGNKFFALARALFGYQDKPTMIEIIIYCSYWVIVLALGFYKWRTGSLFDADYKYKRQLAKDAKKKAKEAELQRVTSDEVAVLDAKKLGLDASKDEVPCVSTSSTESGSAADSKETGDALGALEAAPTQAPLPQQVQHR